MKRKLTFIAVALAAVALAGGAYAATQNSGSNSRQAFLTDVAHRLGVKPAQLNSALEGAFFDRLSAAVTAGRLTSAQADAIEKQVKQSGVVPIGGFGFGAAGAYGPPTAMRSFRGRAFRFGGAFRAAGKAAPGGKAGPAGKFAPAPAFGRPFGPAAGFGFGFAFAMFGGGLSSTASYLGLSGSKLFSELRSGKSLAQIATAQGKTASGLQDAISATVKSRLDHAVAAKRLTSAQEQKLLSRVSAALSAIIHRSFPTPPRYGPRFGGAFHLPQSGSRTKTTG